MRIVQYSSDSTLCGERFQGKILQITMKNRLDAVQYSSVRMILREISGRVQLTQCTDYVHLDSRDYKNIILTYLRTKWLFAKKDSCLYDQYFRSQRWAHFSLPKGHVVSCRFNGALIVSISACRFVMSSVVPYNGRGLKV